MERKEIVNRLGLGVRVLIIRPRRGHGPTVMRLQVRRRWGWRTCCTLRASRGRAPRVLAEQWLKDYEEHPKRFQRR